MGSCTSTHNHDGIAEAGMDSIVERSLSSSSRRSARHAKTARQAICEVSNFLSSGLTTSQASEVWCRYHGESSIGLFDAEHLLQIIVDEYVSMFRMGLEICIRAIAHSSDIDEKSFQAEGQLAHISEVLEPVLETIERNLATADSRYIAKQLLQDKMSRRDVVSKATFVEACATEFGPELARYADRGAVQAKLSAISHTVRTKLLESVKLRVDHSRDAVKSTHSAIKHHRSPSTSLARSSTITRVASMSQSSHKFDR